VVGSLDVPNLWDVDIQLIAGETEIRNCDGCASWKDKTRRPFLVLSPTGERVLQFHEHPFILVIFRCCPKFHSCNKQFRLVISVTSPVTGESFSNAVNIFRKKMVPCKKRKTENPTLPSAFKKTQIATGVMEKALPVFPYTNSNTSVVSPQMMFRLLYSGEDKKELPLKTEKISPVTATLVERIQSPMMAPILHPIKLEPQVPKPFWNLDAHPKNLVTMEHLPSLKVEIANDEEWLDSILNEFHCSLDVEPLPSALDDISSMLDFPPNDLFCSSESLLMSM
jgi:hypothetical protein